MEDDPNFFFLIQIEDDLNFVCKFKTNTFFLGTGKTQLFRQMEEDLNI